MPEAVVTPIPTTTLPSTQSPQTRRTTEVPGQLHQYRRGSKTTEESDIDKKFSDVSLENGIVFSKIIFQFSQLLYHPCPPPGAREIQSMRGRYASYWNAFLFENNLNVFFALSNHAPQRSNNKLHPTLIFQNLCG